MPDLLFVDLGNMPYQESLDIQHTLHEARVAGRVGDCLLLVEHPPVFTLGRQGKRQNLLVPEALLASRGIPLVRIERGGDITFHGPGQLVLYAIFDLRPAMALVELVATLEEIMILVLSEFGVEAGRDPRNRGTWAGGRKLGFVGIAVLRGVSLHGLALNIDPDLTYFGMMHPCGLKDAGITSLSALLGRPVTLQEVRPVLLRILGRVLGSTPREFGLSDLLGPAGVPPPGRARPPGPSFPPTLCLSREEAP